jgi:RNA-directed DNA polymerase
VQGICEQISLVTGGSTTWRDPEVQVGILNRLLLGWASYFRLGYVTGAWRVVQQHACRRLRWWLRRKHKAKRGKGQPYPDMQLDERWGLVNLARTVRRLPLWANV